MDGVWNQVKENSIFENDTRAEFLHNFTRSITLYVSLIPYRLEEASNKVICYNNIVSSFYSHVLIDTCRVKVHDIIYIVRAKSAIS